MPAGWVEDLVWQDVKGFLRDPGEVLERLKEQGAVDQDTTGALEERRDGLLRRHRDKQAEKDHYVKLYAAGHLEDDELETYLRDVNLRAENLRLLLDSVEADLSEKGEQRQLAETTAAWLAALRKRVAEVEADTDGAYATRPTRRGASW